ncbi:MAG: aquaporin [Fimbriimonadaceae bacterium]|nr:aquaporin [Fimbriimonadaceae bacterium]QYK55323.1 MAG: aquaporin [Fimbriimonadaceae bacterium]
MTSKLLTEFIGTLGLVFTICLAVAATQPPASFEGVGVPTDVQSKMMLAAAAQPSAIIAIGFVLMTLVYMGAPASGAHFNPAITTALAISGKMPKGEALPYILSQLVGGTAGAYLGMAVTGHTTPIAPGAGVQTLPALLVEVIFTFILVLVVFNVAVNPKAQGNSYFGLAIGAVIVAGAYAGGGISGGAFNPAVGTGLTIAHALSGGGGWENLWLYLVGPLLGGTLAMLVYKVQEGAQTA